MQNRWKKNPKAKKNLANLIPLKRIGKPKDIANTILNNKDEILNSKYIVFDASSFQNKIEHALVNNEQNILNTYFGFQLFEEWGIKSMIRLLIPFSSSLITTSSSFLFSVEIEKPNSCK